MFPALDWDPKQWLVVLAHYPTIRHALKHKLISMSGLLVLSCEICYVPDSQTKSILIIYQCCSISYKRHVSVYLTQNLSMQMASIGIKETYCIFMLEPKSNESLAKGMVNQSR